MPLATSVQNKERLPGRAPSNAQLRSASDARCAAIVRPMMISRCVNTLARCHSCVTSAVGPRGGTTACWSSSTAGALEGIRVLDLSRVVAAPACTMMLGDMGADVIKVERPTVGDDTRSWGPPFVGGESTYFLSVNRNKRSVAVDFKHPKGRQVLLDMAKHCDVLVENFVPGKLASMGLGYDDVAKVNPRLVYCTITGYGTEGPGAHRAGYDVSVSAIGGLLSITGQPGGPPAKPGVPVVDWMTGLQAHGAVLAALIRRATTGRGQHVECSLLETLMCALSHAATGTLNAGLVPKMWGTAHSSIVPYQCKDGPAVIAAMSDSQFAKLVTVLGQPQLADERFRENAGRVAHRDELIDLMEAELVHRTRAEWMEVLEDAGLAGAPVNTVAEAFEDPQVLYRGMVQTVEHPTAGTVKLPGLPMKLSGDPATIRRPPPTLGQHTAEVLEEVLGLSASDIAQAAAEGWVQVPATAE